MGIQLNRFPLRVLAVGLAACGAAATPDRAAGAAGAAPPALKVYPTTFRQNCLQGERIDVTAVLGPAARGDLEIFLDDTKSAFPVAKQAALAGGSYTFGIDSTWLKPGAYTLRARLGGSEATWSGPRGPLPLRIVSRQPKTNLPIIYLGYIHDWPKLADLGYNLAVVGPRYPPKPEEGRPAHLPRPGLLVPERQLDDLAGSGMKGMVSNAIVWGLAHQPIRRSGCYNDPKLLGFARQQIALAAQFARRFPNLIAFESGDEVALPWTPNRAGNLDTVGSCQFCRAAFQAEAGRPAPAREEWDNDTALWVRWIRWRATTWSDFMQAVGRQLKEVAPDLLWVTDLYAPAALGDGMYPLDGLGGDVLYTHHYATWGHANGQSVAFEACELQRAGLDWGHPFWPIVSGWMLQDVEPQLHRHMFHLAISRKIDGIGTWGPLGGEAIASGKLTPDSPGVRVVRECLAELTRCGDLFRALERTRGDVAVLYSVTEMARLLGGTFADSLARIRHTESFLFPFLEAYMTAYRAHFNTSVILEEEILAGALKHYKVLLVPEATSLPADVAAKIAAFAAGGGAVYVEKRSRLAIAGARRLGLDFTTLLEAHNRAAEARAREDELNDDKPEEQKVYAAWKLECDPVQEAGIDRQSKELGQVLARHTAKFVDTPRPRVMLSEQRSGKGRYVFVVNSEMDPAAPEKSILTPKGLLFLTQPIVPVETTLRFADEAGRYAAYDLEEGKAVDLGKPLAVSLPAGGMKVLCLLPAELEKVEITAPATAHSGTTVSLSITVLGGGKPIEAAIPLELTLISPEGESQTLYRVATDGSYRLTLDLPLNVPPGNWQVAAKELLSGKEAQATFSTTQPADKAPIGRLKPDVEVFDQAAIREFLRSKRPVWVVTGEAASDEVKALARGLASALAAAGPKAEVKTAEAIRQANQNLPAYLDAKVLFIDPATGRGYQQLGRRGEVVTDADGKPLPDPLLDGQPLRRGLRCVSQSAPSWVDISHDLILLGDRASNRLIDDIENAAILPRVLTDEFPGAGKALVEYAWSPFEPGRDVVLLLASRSDIGGLRRGAALLREWMK